MNPLSWPSARCGAEAFSREAFCALSRHLHNDNPEGEFGMGWREDGKGKYVRAKTKRAGQVIQTSAAAVFQTGNPITWTAFVPDSKNEAGQSRWACLDFDAHEGNFQRAEEYAIAGWNALKNLNRDFVVLEHSGAGFHVWLISLDFRPVQEWHELLAGIAKAIAAPIERGICEIYPDASTRSRRGVRVPGSWHPGLNQRNMILAENIKPLLDVLLVKWAPLTSGGFTYTKKHLSFSSSFSKAGELYGEWERQWKLAFSISQPATRHDRLAKFVGHVFHQVGHEMARRLAERQFDEKAVATHADKKEHLAEFENLWEGLRRDFRSSMSMPANFIFEDLNTPNERDAFRIILSFARLARIDERPDFPIAAASLASRIGVTLPGACHLIKRLVAANAIRRTQPAQPQRCPARYEWLLEWDESALA